MEQQIVFLRENKILSKLFIKFLKDNNSLNAYISNLNNIGKDYKYFRKDLFQRNAISCDYFFYDALFLILGAFEWSKTMEGESYWSKLSSKWGELYHNFLIRTALGKK
jgi:hypothetical protein